MMENENKLVELTEAEQMGVAGGRSPEDNSGRWFRCSVCGYMFYEDGIKPLCIKCPNCGVSPDHFCECV